MLCFLLRVCVHILVRCHDTGLKLPVSLSSFFLVKRIVRSFTAAFLNLWVVTENWIPKLFRAHHETIVSYDYFTTYVFISLSHSNATFLIPIHVFLFYFPRVLISYFWGRKTKPLPNLGPDWNWFTP